MLVRGRKIALVSKKVAKFKIQRLLVCGRKIGSVPKKVEWRNILAKC